MAQTVIGLFDNVTKARHAQKELIDNGYKRENVDLSTRSASGDAGRTRTSDRESSDSVNRFFGSLFENKRDVESHAEVARRGAVVTVHTKDMQRAKHAAQILDNSGAVNPDERATRYRRDEHGATGSTGKSEASAEVIEERLEVGKREVETGGVRLRSRIVERPVEEHLRLRKEHVEVERRPVDRPATGADFEEFEEGTIEATERDEVPVVNKKARVVEEVNLRKEVTEEDETIRDTVRRTDVDVEKIDSDERRRREETRRRDDNKRK